jgi:hypothetical protein
MVSTSFASKSSLPFHFVNAPTGYRPNKPVEVSAEEKAAREEGCLWGDDAAATVKTIAEINRNLTAPSNALIILDRLQ